MSYVYNEALKKNIRVKPEELVFMVDRYMEFLFQSSAGRSWLVQKLLKASFNRVEATHQYFPTGAVGDPKQQLDRGKLVEFWGYLYDGKFVSPNDIESVKLMDTEQCEGCGQTFPKSHCVENVRIYVAGQDRLTSMCNNCRLLEDSQKIRDTASRKTCETCSYTTCAFHPKTLAQRGLPPHEVPFTTNTSVFS